MNEFELENYEGKEPEVNDVDLTAESEAEDAGLSTGAAMLIGGLVTAAGIAVANWVGGLWKKHKEKKAAEAEAEKPAEANHDFVVPTDEELEKVTKAK